MGNEMMGLDELAVYLQRDAREVRKMASRGHLPGQRVSGEWRFNKTEINHWIETQLHGYTEQELSALETAGSLSHQTVPEQSLISSMLSEATVAVPLKAGTKSSVLKELVQLAEESWQVYDPEAILEALRQRRRWAARPWPPAWPSRTRTGRCRTRWATTCSPSAAPATASRSAGHTAH